MPKDPRGIFFEIISLSCYLPVRFVRHTKVMSPGRLLFWEDSPPCDVATLISHIAGCFVMVRGHCHVFIVTESPLEFLSFWLLLADYQLIQLRTSTGCPPSLICPDPSLEFGGGGSVSGIVRWVPTPVLQRMHPPGFFCSFGGGCPPPPLWPVLAGYSIAEPRAGPGRRVVLGCHRLHRRPPAGVWRLQRIGEGGGASRRGVV